MNLQAICVANFTGFFLLVFLFISRVITKTKRQPEEYALNLLMYLATIACLVEPLTFYVNGKTGDVYKWVNILGNTYLYTANGLGSFLFCAYVDRKLYDSNERMVRIYRKFGAIVFIMLLTLYFNIWGGYYFYVDQNGFYNRHPLIYIFYIYIMFCCVFCIYISSVHKLKHGKTAFFPVFMYLIPIATGSIIQMIYYGTSLAWLGTAIGIVALHMSLLNQRSYLDILTGLYNRLYLERFIYEIKRSPVLYYGLMLDMNYFKEINDTYGHSAGDQALKDVTRILKICVDSRATVFRYAGDEFIVLIKNSSDEDMEALEKKLREETELFNENGGRNYKISFSLGYGTFDRETDDEDSFLKKIDKKMYAEKARIHEERRMSAVSDPGRAAEPALDDPAQKLQQ